MAWTGLNLTVDGQNALNEAQISNKMNIKAIVIGDGDTPQNFRTCKKLVNQLYEITNLNIDMTEEGCSIIADFPETDKDYYFREIGVIVTTDDGDKLYVYDNCGDDAQYIVNSTNAERIKKRIRLVLCISNVSEITVSNPSILYVTYDDFETEIQKLTNEKLTADGGDASNLKVDFEEAEKLETVSKNEILSKILGKVAKSISNLISHLENKLNPHNVTKIQVGLENIDNTSDKDKPVSTAQQAAIDAVYAQAIAYADQVAANLINGAPTTLDTLKEVADAMAANEDVVAALDEAVGSKASQAEFDSHESNATVHIKSSERTAWNAKLNASGGDSKDVITTFTSNDATNASAWTEVATLTSKEKQSSIFNKVSMMFKNVRFLYKMLGTTDISAIGGGTVTGAISELNSGLDNLHLTTQYQSYTDIKIDGVSYPGNTGIIWMKMKHKAWSEDRTLSIGYVYGSGNTAVWNKYIEKNKILITKSTDGESTEITSIDGFGGLTNTITFYGVQILHNCNGASHHIAFRGTLNTTLEAGVKYTANVPEWCIGNGGGSLAVFSNHTAMVMIKDGVLEFTPTNTIPSGWWLIGGCTVINY